MVRTIQTFELFDKEMVNHFWQSVNAILVDVPVTEKKKLFDAKLLL